VDAGVDAAPVSCTNPQRQKVCPPILDVPSTCVSADADCSTVRKCFGETAISVCPTGSLNICGYRNCIPAGACPAGTKRCPGDRYQEIGPICLPMADECKSVTFCHGEAGAIHSCEPGKWYSCQAKACVAVAAPCATDPRFPQACPARGTAEASCATPYQDCATATKCATRVFAVDTDETVSCQYANFNTPVGNKCPTSRNPSLSKFCPAGAGAGPSCYRPNADCATLTMCNGKPAMCTIGTKVDCRYPNCTPIDLKCPTFGFPEFSKFCPAQGGVGPGCYWSDTDCSTVVNCPTEGTYGACPTGKKWDCATGTCI
jgi:hypothetical protein